MRRFFFLLMLLFPVMLHAQNRLSLLPLERKNVSLASQALIDSLSKQLLTAKDDSSKIMLWNQLSTHSGINITPEEGLKYADSALRLALQINWKTGIAWSQLSYASNCNWKADYSDAMKYALDALRIGEASGNKAIIAEAYIQLCAVYCGISVDNDSLKNGLNIAKGLDYANKALAIYTEINDKKGMGSAEENIGMVWKCDYVNFKFVAKHNDLGDAKGFKALEYYNKALDIFKKINDQQGIARGYANIGTIWQIQGNYKLALDFYAKAVVIFDQLGNQQSLAKYLARNGQICLYSVQSPGNSIGGSRSENLHRAILYFSRAIELSNKIKKTEGLSYYYSLLSIAFELSGDCKNAFATFQKSKLLEASDQSKDNEIKISKLEIEHTLELKNKDIELYNKKIELDKLAIAKKKNERVFYIIAMGLLVSTILIVFRNYRNQIQSNKLLSHEKKRSDDLLLNILPAEVAEEIKDTGTAATKFFDDVTVIFTDFVGFTQAGERMTPNQLVAELNTCFKVFDKIITSNKIEKIKTVGDAYLAVSGLPVANPHHAEDVVRAALEIMQFMAERKRQLGDMAFEIRIGIHSGSVVAGIVGLKKFAYDIWGDTVNTAARMEQNCEPGKINISQSTYELVKDKFKCTYRGEILAKNKGEMKMYFVE